MVVDFFVVVVDFVVVKGGPGGVWVGDELSGVNFKNPNAPPKVSLSTKIITSPELGSTAKYSPALFAP